MAITPVEALIRLFRWLKRVDGSEGIRQIVISRYGQPGKWKIAAMIDGREIKRISDGSAGTELATIEKLLIELGE